MDRQNLFYLYNARFLLSPLQHKGINVGLYMGAKGVDFEFKPGVQNSSIIVLLIETNERR